MKLSEKGGMYMMKYLWSFLIIISVIISVFTGKISETMSGAMEGAENAVTMCMGLLGVMCMWNGIIKIAEKSGITQKISAMFSPLIKIIFKSVSPKTPAANYIMMNMSANLLGLGNAATPLGLSAVKEMKKEGSISDIMIFTVLNTASFQLLPTTLIAMRLTAGANNPGEILIPVWGASICSVVVAVLCGKMWSK